MAQILIVDDDRHTSHFLKVALESEGHTVKACHDAATGLMAARSDAPDLLILDISMPAGSGFNLLEQLLEDERRRDVRAIFITGHHNPRLIDRAQDLGAVGFLHKPYDVDEVLELVRAALAGV